MFSIRGQKCVTDNNYAFDISNIHWNSCMSLVVFQNRLSLNLYWWLDHLILAQVPFAAMDEFTPVLMHEENTSFPVNADQMLL